VFTGVTGVRALLVSRIVEFSFHKTNEYFVYRWTIAQKEQGEFGKARAEHLEEAQNGQ
jgi:hypothetical protein